MSEVPPRIALVGPMGSGKTTVGAALATRTGHRLVDTDAEVEAQAGRSIPSLFATEGEAVFRRRERDVLAAALEAEDPVVVATGGGAVTDPGSRRLLAERATVVWLTAPPDVLAVRVRDGETRPLLSGRDPVEVLEELCAARHDAYAEVADIRVDATVGTADELAARICDALGVSA